MMFLNEYEVYELGAEVRESGMQNAHRAQIVLKRLVDWTNQNSDGWPYWSKPSRAATQLQNALYSRFRGAFQNRVEADMTDAELKKAFSPIKAFMTRQNVDSRFLFQGI